VLRNNLAQLFINMDEWHTAKDVPISRHISACKGSEILSTAAGMAVQIINFVSWLLPAAASVQQGRYAVSASMPFHSVMDYEGVSRCSLASLSRTNFQWRCAASASMPLHSAGDFMRAAFAISRP